MPPHALRAPDWRFLATLASITLVGPLAIHFYLPAMPAVKAVFGMSDALVGTTYSAVLYVMAFATLVYGSLSDRYGRRPTLLAGLSLFTLGSVACALAPSTPWLIAGRVLQAVGVACGVTLARAIARDAFGTEHLVRVIAYLTMAYTIGPMIAAPLGGVLVDAAGWHSVFWFAAVAGATILLASWVVLQETHGREQRTTSKSGGVLHDYVRLFSHPRFAAYVLQSGLSSGCFYTLAAAASFLMKDVLGRSATEFGSAFLAFPVGFFTGNLIASRIGHRFGAENMVIVGSAINLLAVSGQSIAILTGHLSPWILFVPAFLITFGQGIALPSSQTGAMRVIPTLSGTAAGIAVFCQGFFGASFAQIYSSFADGTPIPLVATLWTCSVLCMIAGTVPFILKSSGR
jgi:MFS transporter, DHA1 family, multidrug resistance protein